MGIILKHKIAPLFLAATTALGYAKSVVSNEDEFIQPSLQNNQGFSIIVTNVNDECDYARHIELVKIPSDFVHYSNDSSIYDKAVDTQGAELTAENGKRIYEYINSETSNVQTQPDFYVIDSPGGSIDGAKDIINGMKNRQEIFYVKFAESSATVLMAYADSVYAQSGMQDMITHEARSYNEFSEAASKELKRLTGKTEDLLVQDFESIYNSALSGEITTILDIKDVKKAVDKLTQGNEYVINSYMHNNPTMPRACAESMVLGINDKPLSAETALARGIVDAVLLNPEKQDGGYMLVRADDPRAVKFKEESPDLYTKINMYISDKPETEGLVPPYDGYPLGNNGLR